MVQDFSHQQYQLVSLISSINGISLRLHDITAIQSNENAFAARRADGQVIVWGSERDGGTLPTDIEIRAMAVPICPRWVGRGWMGWNWLIPGTNHQRTKARKGSTYIVWQAGEILAELYMIVHPGWRELTNYSGQIFFNVFGRGGWDKYMCNLSWCEIEDE